MNYAWGVTCIIVPSPVSGIFGITSDDAGNIYFTDALGHIWIWNKHADQHPDAFITTDTEDFTGIAWDRHNFLYVTSADWNRSAPRLGVVSIQNRELEWMVNTGNMGHMDGVFEEAELWDPRCLCIDNNDNQIIYLTDRYRIRRINMKSRTIETLCGHTTRKETFNGRDDGTLEEADFFGPAGIAMDKEGGIYVADPDVQTIRKIKDGVVSTFRNRNSFRAQCPKQTILPFGCWPTGIAILNDETLVSCGCDGYVRMHNLKNSTISTLHLPCIHAMKSVSLFSLHIDLEGSIFVGTKDLIFQIDLHWKWQRIIWIGHIKEHPYCLFAKLPKELIRYILRLVDIPVKTYRHQVPELNFLFPNAKKQKRK